MPGDAPLFTLCGAMLGAGNFITLKPAQRPQALAAGLGPLLVDLKGSPAK